MNRRIRIRASAALVTFCAAFSACGSGIVLNFDPGAGPDASVGPSSSSSSGGGSSSGSDSSSSGSGSSSGSSSSGSDGSSTSSGSSAGLDGSSGGPAPSDVDAQADADFPPLHPPCPAGADWLPVTPLPNVYKPPSHPALECPFNQWGFQYFLVATQPDSTTGEAAIVTYPTIDDVFTKSTPLPPGALAPSAAHRGTALRAWLGNIKQAGLREILIDQNGHTLYYGIHVNQAFVDFVHANGLTTVSGVTGTLGTSPTLSFPAGVVEFQSAWADIDVTDGISAADHANFVSNFITTMAWVPTLSQGPTGVITEDKNHPRRIQVALVALNVAYTLPGHPEFIFTSFEHLDANGYPDTAGVAIHNPLPSDPTNSTLRVDTCPATLPFDAGNLGPYLLCKAGTPANQGDRAFKETDLALDAARQTFFLAASPATVAQTSIYRVHPASASNKEVTNDDVFTLNGNMDSAWAVASAKGVLDPNDRRASYRLAGGIWLDKPALFALNSSLQNTPDSNPLLAGPDAGAGGGGSPLIDQADERAVIWAGGLTSVAHDLYVNGTYSPFSILGGEDRLSSTAIESFTQSADKFDHCFTCHNTQAVSVNGTPTDRAGTSVRTLLKPGLLNVSHVFSEFVQEECPATGIQPTGCPPQ
jgi:hypothetical protein